MRRAALRSASSDRLVHLHLYKLVKLIDVWNLLENISWGTFGEDPGTINKPEDRATT
jgi:hypothetical protein